MTKPCKNSSNWTKSIAKTRKNSMFRPTGATKPRKKSINWTKSIAKTCKNSMSRLTGAPSMRVFTWKWRQGVQPPKSSNPSLKRQIGEERKVSNLVLKRQVGFYRWHRFVPAKGLVAKNANPSLKRQAGEPKMRTLAFRMTTNLEP